MNYRKIQNPNQIIRIPDAVENPLRIQNFFGVVILRFSVPFSVKSQSRIFIPDRPRFARASTSRHQPSYKAGPKFSMYLTFESWIVILVYSEQTDTQTF